MFAHDRHPPGVVGFEQDVGAHFRDCSLGVRKISKEEFGGLSVVGAVFVVQSFDDELAPAAMRMDAGDFPLEHGGSVGSLTGCFGFRHLSRISVVRGSEDDRAQSIQEIALFGQSLVRVVESVGPQDRKSLWVHLGTDKDVSVHKPRGWKRGWFFPRKGCRAGIFLCGLLCCRRRRFAFSFVGYVHRCVRARAYFCLLLGLGNGGGRETDDSPGRPEKSGTAASSA